MASNIVGIRIPQTDRVPFGLPIGLGWLSLVYNPGDDTTYAAQMQEMPFLKEYDMYRTMTWFNFIIERDNGRLRLGRFTRITERVGTRSDSDVIVLEVESQKIGLALECFPNSTNPVQLGDVVLVRYDVTTDTISDFTASSNGSNSSLDTKNVYDIPTAKRTAVADAIISKVSSGGQAYLDETDGSYLGKIIVDDRKANEYTVITCHQKPKSTNSPSGYCWIRVICS